MRPMTHVATLTSFRKGSLDIFSGDPKHYAFSNIFEVANMTPPFSRVAVTKNMEYVTEVMKVDGISPWFCAAHDEFALVMDGEVVFDFLQLNPQSEAPLRKHGAVQLVEPIGGKYMGMIRARRGHLVLLPEGAAYQAKAQTPSVVLLQTLAGELTQERWSDICLK